MTEVWDIDELSAGTATGQSVGPVWSTAGQDGPQNFFIVGSDFCANQI